jgi:LuxR family transcriptional regulator
MEPKDKLSHKETRMLIDRVAGMLTTRTTNTLDQALGWLQELTWADQLVICRMTAEKSQVKIEQVYNYSFNAQWVDIYIAENYANIDPVLKYATIQQGAFEWDFGKQRPNLYFPRKFAESAQDHGLRSGISFSVCSCAQARQFTLCSAGNVAPHRYSVSRDALSALVPAFQIVLEANRPLGKVNEIQLTDKERSVLAWLSKGKSVWDTSVILSVSESTIKFHQKNIYRKLGVSNRAHAIAKAVQCGLLETG